MEALTQGLGRQDIIQLLFTNIVAFLIFLFLLRKFAWGPLMSLLDARREKIKADYAAAAGKLGEAEQLRADYDAKLAEIKALERERLQEAVKRGEEISGRLQEEARAKAGDFLGRAEAELEREVGAARLELRAQVVTLALGAAEKLMKEKLDDAKHRQLVENFIQELGDVRA
jgi:F-type H+-transporting ATPase subunit b